MHPLPDLCPATPPLSSFTFDSDVNRRKQRVPCYHAYKHHKMRECVSLEEARRLEPLAYVSGYIVAYALRIRV